MSKQGDLKYNDNQRLLELVVVVDYLSLSSKDLILGVIAIERHVRILTTMTRQ